MYALRAEGQALTADRLNTLCEAAIAKVWGDAVTDELGSGKLWWASLPHFVQHRFYTHAYTFPFLLAAGLVSRSRERGFAGRYERFLVAGGSASPEELLDIVGVDLGDRRSGTTGSQSWRVSSSVCARGGAGAPETPAGSLTHRRLHLTPH